MPLILQPQLPFQSTAQESCWRKGEAINQSGQVSLARASENRGATRNCLRCQLAVLHHRGAPYSEHVLKIAKGNFSLRSLWRIKISFKAIDWQTVLQRELLSLSLMGTSVHQSFRKSWSRQLRAPACFAVLHVSNPPSASIAPIILLLLIKTISIPSSLK